MNSEGFTINLRVD